MVILNHKNGMLPINPHYLHLFPIQRGRRPQQTEGEICCDADGPFAEGGA